MLNSNFELTIRESKGPILHFSNLFLLISTVPLSILSEVINAAYLKFIPFLELFEKLKTNGVLKSSFESKHISFHVISTVPLDILNKVVSSAYLTLNSLILICKSI